jgi:LPXTG-motif cell wall-anchored protein
VYRTNSFPLPARRRAAVLGAATALAAGAAVLAPAAQAAPAGTAHGGTSSAAVLRAGLDVSLLGRAVHLPVDVSLNDVHAPADAHRTALTVTVGSGVEHGRAVTVLRADAATAKATADAHKAEGYADLVHAQVHLPGLPLLALVKADALTSTATCEAGHRPTAHSELAGVTVLGRRIDLGAVGTTELDVPAVGRVSVALTRTSTTSTTAAATALRLSVHVNPLVLGVAKVDGEVTLAQASCRTPHGSGSTSGGTSGGSTSGTTSGTTTGTSGGTTSGTTAGTSGASTSGTTAGTSGSTSGTSGTSGGTAGSAGSTGATGTSGTSGASGGTGASGTGGSGGTGAVDRTTPDTGNLAETGASSSTPYLALGAAGLVAAGAAAYLLTARRRRTAAAPQD